MGRDYWIYDMYHSTNHPSKNNMYIYIYVRWGNFREARVDWIGLV